MVKNLKYTPIQGDELNLEVALSQAANALDAAAGIAQDKGDQAALITIAERWMTMCNGLAGIPASQGKTPIGFTAPVNTQQRDLGVAANDKD